MSRSTELVCPSGLRVKLRSIKGKDVDALRDKRKAATGEGISELLDACTIEIIDRTIYSSLPSFSWADAIDGDRTAAVLGLRIATSGSSYDFRVRCQDPGCRAMIDWTVDLNDLPRKELSAESRATYLAGNRFVIQGCGHDITFKLKNGRDQVQFAKFMASLAMQQKQQVRRGAPEKNERAMLGLASRIVSVDGVEDITSWLEDQDLRDLRALVRQMDDADCGIETGIEVECVGRNGCGLRQEIELPLDKGFFAQDI
jgi:hypothetical protein